MYKDSILSFVILYSSGLQNECILKSSLPQSLHNQTGAQCYLLLVLWLPWEPRLRLNPTMCGWLHPQTEGWTFYCRVYSRQFTLTAQWVFEEGKDCIQRLSTIPYIDWKAGAGNRPQTYCLENITYCTILNTQKQEALLGSQGWEKKCMQKDKKFGSALFEK